MINFNLESFESLPIGQLEIFLDDKKVGRYLLVPHSEELWEVHTDLSPEVFGSSVDISLKAQKYLLEVVPKINCLVTKVPVNNKLAKRLVISCGWSLCGNIPKSYLFNNQFVDQEMYSISKEAICQHL